DDARWQKPARLVDDDALDRLAGHLLGGVDRVADRIAGGFEVDHLAAAHSARHLMPDADDARPLGLDPGDKAADLRRADIDRGDEAAARPHRREARPAPARVRGGGNGRRGLVAAVYQAHVGFPARCGGFFAGAVSFGAAASVRITSRSVRRMSTVSTSRLR